MYFYIIIRCRDGVLRPCRSIVAPSAIILLKSSKVILRNSIILPRLDNIISSTLRRCLESECRTHCHYVLQYLTTTLRKQHSALFSTGLQWPVSSLLKILTGYSSNFIICLTLLRLQQPKRDLECSKPAVRSLSTVRIFGSSDLTLSFCLCFKASLVLSQGTLVLLFIELIYTELIYKIPEFYQRVHNIENCI